MLDDPDLRILPAQNLKRREFILVDDLVVAEHFFGVFSRPIEMFHGPMNEDAFERFGLGEANRSILLGILQCQKCAAQQRRAH